VAHTHRWGWKCEGIDEGLARRVLELLMQATYGRLPETAVIAITATKKYVNTEAARELKLVSIDGHKALGRILGSRGERSGRTAGENLMARRGFVTGVPSSACF